MRGAVAKRLFDVPVAALLLLLCSPVLVIAALGIWLTSPGPLLYRARRTGRHGTEFYMFKLRTMHVETASASAITAPGDTRIFPFGRVIREFKIDELPQFWNILIGDMSLVGPRAEDPMIVSLHYSDWMIETLSVAPGLTSPGAIYGYMVSDTFLDPNDPESSYVARLLRPKLALERAYIERANFVQDICYIILTIWAIIGRAFGRQTLLPQADIEAAKKWAPEGFYPSSR